MIGDLIHSLLDRSRLAASSMTIAIGASGWSSQTGSRSGSSPTLSRAGGCWRTARSSRRLLSLRPPDRLGAVRHQGRGPPADERVVRLPLDGAAVPG